MRKGKIVAIYGINNLGKSTQVEMLVERVIKESGLPTSSLKYPIYNLEPFGPLINQCLREDNPLNLSPREFQMLYVLNRVQADSKIRAMAEMGQNLILEDYWGTGVAWGTGSGVEQEFLVRLNQSLIKEDQAILLDGERFDSGREKNHIHEEDNDLTERVRKAHLALAEWLAWWTVDANQSREKVHEDIWRAVSYLFS